MESALIKFLQKGYGDYESAEVVSDNGKTVIVKVDFGDGEVYHTVINRRKGDNGNYRTVSER